MRTPVLVTVLFTLIAALCSVASLDAQRVRFGVAAGTSWIGGADSRVLVDAGGFNVTGASQAGHHLRGFAEWPLNSGGLAFRAELFYNSLHSRPNTVAIVGSGSGSAALTDRTIGLTGNLIATVSPRARVSPYFAFGAGILASRLGTNSDPQSDQVAVTRGGMGLGLQTGLGLRFKVGGKNLLLDWRYVQALNNTRGAAFMPFTIGFQF
jgi:hypothetical protein